MAKIKEDRNNLEMLLNTIEPPASNVSNNNLKNMQYSGNAQSIIDNNESFPEEKIFEFDYDGVKDKVMSRAKKTVMFMARHVLTEKLLEEEYVKDKIEQDIETLAQLYMQVEANNIMQRSILETVSRGNTMPRMFEVFGQLTDKIQNINKQVLTTENQIRKTYADLKFEIKDKANEILEEEQYKALPESKTETKEAEIESPNNIITSAKQLIMQAKKQHIESLSKIKETECIETDD